MKFKPRPLDHIISIIAEWPEKRRSAALKAIQEEGERLKKGDYTQEERLVLEAMSKMGTAAANHYEQIILDVLGG